MSRPPVAHLGAEQPNRSPSAGIARTSLLEVDRQKRIDHYIDYFGNGGARRTLVTPDPCGESLLDADGAR